jgi:hypothetical protein
MKLLAKIGAAMVILSAVMTVGFYSVLKAREVEVSTNPADRMLVIENRTVSALATVVEIDGPIDLKIKQGAVASMMVSAEKGRMTTVHSEQNGDTLHIYTKGFGFHHRYPIKVELTLPALQKLSTKGSGDNEVSGFTGDQIALRLNGSGDLKFNSYYQKITADLRGSGDMQLNGGNSDKVDVNLMGSGGIIANGQTKSLTLILNGSGDVDTQALHADSSDVNLNGSGDVSVFAQKMIDISLKGSGDITVFGNPAQRTISKRGSGEVSFQ